MTELGRRAVHASGTGIPALYLLGVVDWPGVRLLLVGLSVAVTALEFVRLVLDYEWPLFDQLAREYERENVAGYALYAYSQAVVALLFTPAVALPGMVMLTIGDPVSGYLGDNDAGTAKQAGVLGVMFFVCFALAAPFTVAVVGLPVGVAAAATGAAGATLADGVKPVVAGRVIDDNASIPIAAALGITLVFVAAGAGIEAVLWL
ncbi:dolichol kinase [Halolamina litorea]|uniref:Dolichol kinase n=1 Tax=Halolamina litorea TaxID=1515593 RepID=A0ABD6BRX5_9EURY|nr:dolichol kinase [Halolamina litorea]